MGRIGTAVLSSLFLLLGIGGFGGLIWLKLSPPPGDSAFAGSGACAGCHREIAAAWSASQHTKIRTTTMAPTG
jgi:hypothetical protein